MRMIMRIDETGHDQSPGCIDQIMYAVGREIRADREYLVSFDQDIGDGWLMHVTGVVVDLATADQHSPRCHYVRALCRQWRAGFDAFFTSCVTWSTTAESER